MAALTRNHWHEEPILKKNGKPGLRTRSFLHPYCPVVRCDWCLRLGSPAWIRRWYMRPWRRLDLRKTGWHPPKEPVVCIGCMNRVRSDWKAETLIEENRLLIGRIKKEITRVNAKNCRRSAELSG